jgi:hypothetical protein
MKLSKNLSLSEVIKSNTATRKGIDNSPNNDHLESLEDIAKDIFQPLRDDLGVIYVSSGYRSDALNKAIGGSRKSQHSKGEALDLDNDNKNKAATNTEIFNYIKDNLDFDQLIWEFGTDEKPDWVHVSYTTKRPNRNQILKAYRQSGKTKYKSM